MARIVVGSYMVRYPLGGMMSWTLQWLVGLQRLGHDVFFVEKSTYPDSCYNPRTKINSDDASYGLQVVADLLERHGLSDRLCYVDYPGNCHAADRDTADEWFRTADLFLDLGTHGAWLEEARAANTTTVLVDGEPGYTQSKMENRIARAEALDDYDFYFSNGANIGTGKTTAPTGGKCWHSVFNPVVTDLFTVAPPPSGAPYSTVMNWESHKPFEFEGRVYGQKDVEFAKVIDLPQKTGAPLEVAVSGADVPAANLEAARWRLRDAQEVTASYHSYITYLRRSRGEFSVCKNIFVAMKTGWFSDRSAAYLASGRPVVLQDTGFSDHLPTGDGLFAFNDLDGAAAAIEAIEGDYDHHARTAREIARHHLDATLVLKRFLDELGL